MSAIIGDGTEHLLRALLAGVVGALKQRDVGIAHRLAVFFCDRALDAGVRHQAKGEVAGVEIGSNGDTSEEVAVLVEALCAVSVCARSKRVLPYRQVRKGEPPVRGRYDVALELLVFRRDDGHLGSA